MFVYATSRHRHTDIQTQTRTVMGHAGVERGVQVKFGGGNPVPPLSDLNPVNTISVQGCVLPAFASFGLAAWFTCAFPHPFFIVVPKDARGARAFTHALDPCLLPALIQPMLLLSHPSLSPLLLDLLVCHLVLLHTVASNDFCGAERD